MSAPFPGMDPFLESPAYWRRLHQCFITYWRDWLLDHLPDHYEVRIDERLSVVDEEAERKDMLPDLSVSQSYPLPHQLVHEAAVAVLDKEPVTRQLKYLQTAPEAYLRVLHRPDASLIAVLELLSPTNKSGQGRRDYLLKRQELLQEPVHLVELDLLLGGTRLPIKGKFPVGDYHAFVSTEIVGPSARCIPGSYPSRSLAFVSPSSRPIPTWCSIFRACSPMRTSVAGTSGICPMPPLRRFPSPRRMPGGLRNGSPSGENRPLSDRMTRGSLLRERRES